MKNIRNRLFNRKFSSVTARWIVLLIDISIVLQAFFIAYVVRFNFTLNFGSYHFLQQLPLVAVMALLSFGITGSYKGVVRHTGTKDIYKVFLASLLLSILLVITVVVNKKLSFNNTFTIPKSIIAIHFFINLFILIASRFIFKKIYNILVSASRQQKKVLIYGAGDSGLITHATLLKDTKIKVKVVGYIDDNKNKKGKTYDGVMVFHPSQINNDFIINRNIKEIIISIQNISSADLMNIVDAVSLLPVKLKIVPPVEQWIDGTLKVSQIEDVKIEDLLERKPIKLDNPTVQKEFKDKTILITGAAGSIGSELASQISGYNYKNLILLDQAESGIYDLQQEFFQKNAKNFEFIVGDITDASRLKEVFKKYNIQIIFHAAAYKHVPLMEDNPYEAVQVNVLGSKKLMDLAVEYDVDKFIMVSTDKAVNPTNVMGATKRTAEIYASFKAKEGNTTFITTRFGNVLGSNGSVVPLFKKQIKKGGPLTVTHKEITRFFMTIPEACELVIEACTMGQGSEIFVFDMGKSVKIFELAKKMIKLSGFKYPEEIDIKIVGLRQGEKLYEELLNDSENTRPTHHPKIMIAEVSNIDEKSLRKSLKKLQSIANLSATEIVTELKNMVPEYKSNNSIYSKLD